MCYIAPLMSCLSQIKLTYDKYVHVFILGPCLKKAAKGKLLDCFNNRKREYKKSGLIATQRHEKLRIESKSVLLLPTNSSNIGKFIFYINVSIDNLHDILFSNNFRL